eukprot:594359-Pelagomonas_calceolata.AAC.3
MGALCKVLCGLVHAWWQNRFWFGLLCDIGSGRGPVPFTSTSEFVLTNPAGTKKYKERERYVQRLFEAAVDAYGAEDADMWLAYTRFEVTWGTAVLIMNSIIARFLHSFL